MNDMLFSLTGDKSISKIDPASGAAEKIDSDIASGKFTLAAAMPDLNTIFILTADKKVISFTPSNKKFQENNISFPDNLNASDMKAYLTYIYVLDPSANQIYRYPRAEGGFGDVQNWLKDGQDLKGADKFAINDDIFAANNLNVIPLLQGKIDSAIDFQKPQIPLAHRRNIHGHRISQISMFSTTRITESSNIQKTEKSPRNISATKFPGSKIL